MNLLECLALNSPPLTIANSPRPRAASVATIAMIMRTGRAEDIKEIWLDWRQKAIDAAGHRGQALDFSCRTCATILMGMSFLDHIARCNAHDPHKFVLLIVDGEAAGHIRKDHLVHLERFPGVFKLSGDAVRLADGLDAYEERTASVDMVVRALFEDGVLAGWRGEPYPVGGKWGGPHAFEIERAAAPFFGARAYGVHVNGFVRDGDDLKMWVAVRADDRPVCPGKLDNMIAGGQPVTLGLKENVIKEAAEEAGMPRNLAEKVIPVGAITYTMENEVGLKPDMMFCWDLALPAGFRPSNEDGEVAEFRLLPVEEVMEIVETTDDFKFNCNLVIIDFCIRHGVLPPEHSDYETILRGLRC